jgi:tetratricopeptide (TPR) repeat protein
MKSIHYLFILISIGICSCKNNSNTLENENKRNESDIKAHHAKLSYNNGNYSEAEKLYNEAVKIDPYNPYAYYERAHHKKYNLKDYAGAISDYTSSIKIFEGLKAYQTTFLDCYADRADAKNNLKDYYGAIADYNSAIEMNPSISILYIERGFIKYNSLNDSDGACADWSKAGELGRRDAYDYIQKYCN